jgi:hypothetical protein
VRFRVEPLADALRFHVEVHDRASNIVDWLVMSNVGGAVQVSTWRATVEHVIEASGGIAPDGVQSESTTLRGEEAREVERWASSVIDAHARAVHAAGAIEGAGNARSR